MADTSTISATAGVTAKAAASTSLDKLNSDKTAFLKLLTSQLKNQDPLSPMDSSEFTNQLVQYSQVEQQISINSNLGTLITLAQQNNLSSAASYLGKAIQATSDSAPLQSGAMTLSYNLSANAASSTIVIRDASGAVVHAEQGSNQAGSHVVTWDGKDASGVQQADGAYSVTVTALGSDGKAVDTSTTVYGSVTSVTTDPTSGETVLRMGGVSIPLSKVVAVG